ncbi:MAG: response regulator transcription factor [Anaerolineales bacterium]|nr:response regulator transcription factor [Anaerolineales bacterium]
MNSISNRHYKTCVLLLADASVLDLAVEGLLSQDTVLEIIRPESSLDSALQRIRASKPDVIIVNEARQQRGSALTWQRILHNRPGTCLIVLNAHETSMSIYKDGTHTMQPAGGLLAAVQRPDLI